MVLVVIILKCNLITKVLYQFLNVIYNMIFYLIKTDVNVSGVDLRIFFNLKQALDYFKNESVRI